MQKFWKFLNFISVFDWILSVNIVICVINVANFYKTTNMANPTSPKQHNKGMFGMFKKHKKSHDYMTVEFVKERPEVNELPTWNSYCKFF